MSKPTIATLTSTVAQLNGAIENQAAVIKNHEVTLKAQYEEKKKLQDEVIRLKDALKGQAARAIMAEEELANLKDQLEEQEVQVANRTTTTTQGGWKGLNYKQLDWLKEQGCSFTKTASGFKLFLKGEALTCSTPIATALKGKVCKDCNTTWIYFS
jgi:hypothetical protein